MRLRYTLALVAFALLSGPTARAQAPASPCIREVTGSISPAAIATALKQAESACASPARTRSLVRTRTLTPVAVSLIFPNVQFAFNQASLLPEALPILNALGTFLESPEGRGYRVQIEGHTDAVGSDDYNLVLSQHRANTVRAYLSEQVGISPNRLEGVGFGKQRPLPGHNPFDDINRRVEFKIEHVQS